MRNDREGTTMALEAVYCESCRLATPIWRGRCIHCRAVLPSEQGKRKMPIVSRGSRRH
jgi:hypothetical protein